jgi:hypothetical protein
MFIEQAIPAPETGLGTRLTASGESRGAARATLRREHEACSISTVNAAEFDELSESEKGGIGAAESLL